MQFQIRCAEQELAKLLRWAPAQAARGEGEGPSMESQSLQCSRSKP